MFGLCGLHNLGLIPMSMWIFPVHAWIGKSSVRINRARTKLACLQISSISFAFGN